MIRILLAHRGGLVRGALAFVLGAEDDIEVVGQTDRFEDLVDTVLAHHPDVTVLDLDLLPGNPGRWPGGLPCLWALNHTLPGCRVLVLAEARRAAAALGAMIARPVPGLGFVATNGPPGRLVAGVRRAAAGEPVVDPELVVHALRTRSPLTPRETQVLCVAAAGTPVGEIAELLQMSPGTVRNHLSRVLGKTGARTRIEAVRIAQDAGWI